MHYRFKSDTYGRLLHTCFLDTKDSREFTEKRYWNEREIMGEINKHRLLYGSENSGS
jgi:hypothetical protein